MATPILYYPQQFIEGGQKSRKLLRRSNRRGCDLLLSPQEQEDYDEILTICLKGNDRFYSEMRPVDPTTLVCTLSPITSRTLKSPVAMEHFTLSTVLVVALLLSTGLVRSLPVDTGDDLGTIIFSSVLFRHGDRAPTGTYPNDIYNEEAKYWPRGYGQLSNIFRHGDRTILGSYRNDPYNNQTKYWPRGYKQLTEIGEDQHFKQGSFFRKRYNHILPEIYNVNDLYVRSTNIDRALASAQAHLAGLYPPTEQNHCPAQHKVPKSVMDVRKSSITYERSIKIASDQIKQSSSTRNCTVYLFQNGPNHITHSLLRISSCSKGSLRNSATKKLQRLSAGPILKEIIANTQAKVKGTLSPDRKLYIYSAHDTNVVDLLQGLKVFNGFLVPYASAVLIELRIKADEYFITVLYKNSTELDPYLLQMPGWDALCP
ncbi:unnamed protein product [Timema podura]|uniref:acid phosphatase n=1 Tax=Timema podura TaxID=61482 RepID=A0ABN7NI63_TIMPD|nr:unnamed protein product [Timema podura]